MVFSKIPFTFLSPAPMAPGSRSPGHSVYTALVEPTICHLLLQQWLPQGVILPTGDIWQYVETVVVATVCGGAAGVQWAEPGMLRNFL